jgi:hypothetical protein
MLVLDYSYSLFRLEFAEVPITHNLVMQSRSQIGQFARELLIREPRR